MRQEPELSAEEVRARALAVIAADPFPMLATADGNQPRVRPVSPLKTDGFTVYIASLRSSDKTGQIERNNRVELCYLTKDHDQVRLTGTAHVVTDPAIRQEIWDSSPLLRAYLKSIDNPEFVLYRIDPQRVRYMREWALVYHEAPLEAVDTEARV
jgi:general stress protein 26